MGFDMDTVLRDPEKWDHFGIRGILERARLVGGEGKIQSKKGRGTTIVVDIPLVEKGDNIPWRKLRCSSRTTIASFAKDLAAILKTKEDIHVIGEAQDGMEAVEKVKTLVPDVVLMDVSMPRMGGVEATRQIKREFPHIGIVALTMYDEQQYIFDLVRAGATGYLLKDSESSQIVAAIRAIYKGESLIHPSVASKILAEFSLMSQKKGRKPGWVEHDLTEREITVLRLVADGKTNKEIANNLDLSEKTVKNHVRNIFHKLQVYDRTQAAILAIRKGLIELDPRP